MAYWNTHEDIQRLRLCPKSAAFVTAYGGKYFIVTVLKSDAVSNVQVWRKESYILSPSHIGGK